MEITNPVQEAHIRRPAAPAFRNPGGPQPRRFEPPQISQLQPKRNLNQPQFGMVSVGQPVARTMPEAQGNFSAGMVHQSMPIGGFQDL